MTDEEQKKSPILKIWRLIQSGDIDFKTRIKQKLRDRFKKQKTEHKEE